MTKIDILQLLSKTERNVLFYYKSTQSKLVKEGKIGSEEIKKVLTIIEDNIKEVKNLDNIEWHIFAYIGHLHFLLENYTSAMAYYRSCFHHHNWKIQDQENKYVMYGLALCFNKFNCFTWAISALLGILFIFSDFDHLKDVYYLLGTIYKCVENNTISRKYYSLATCIYGEFISTECYIKFNLIHLLELECRYKKALMEYEQLLNDPDLTNKTKSAIYRQIGSLYYENCVPGSPELVEKYFKESIEFSDSGETCYLLGRFYADHGKVREAFTYYRKSIDKGDCPSDTWCSIGILYQKKNQAADALRSYICALQLNEKHYCVWRNLGVLYDEMDQLEDAEICYKRAISYSPVVNRKIVMDRLKNMKMEGTMTPGTSLLSINDAWNVPNPCEITSQQKMNREVTKMSEVAEIVSGHFKASSDSSNYLKYEYCADIFPIDLVHINFLRLQLENTVDEPTMRIPPPPSPNDNIYASTLIFNEELEIFYDKIQPFCRSHTVTILKKVIVLLEIDLGLFTPKLISKFFPKCKVQCYTQKDIINSYEDYVEGKCDVVVEEAATPYDENNFNPDTNYYKKRATQFWWKISSEPRIMDIFSYSDYQKRSHLTFMKTRCQDVNFNGNADSNGNFNVKRNREVLTYIHGYELIIENYDILKNIAKCFDVLPDFLNPNSLKNMFSYIKESFTGINVPRISMWVPGSRQSPRMPVLSTYGIYVNTGPGILEWYVIDSKHYNKFKMMTESLNINLNYNNYWPNLTELKLKKIPVIMFSQKTGDVVHLKQNTIYWIESTGWSNSISWCTAAVTKDQFIKMRNTYLYNQFNSFPMEFPLIQLAWNIHKSITVDESLSVAIIDFLKYSLNAWPIGQSIQYSRQNNIEVKYHKYFVAYNCYICFTEIWNQYFSVTEYRSDVVHRQIMCMKCVYKHLYSKNAKLVMIYRYTQNEVDDEWSQIC